MKTLDPATDFTGMLPIGWNRSVRMDQTFVNFPRGWANEITLRSRSQGRMKLTSKMHLSNNAVTLKSVHPFTHNTGTQT